jgi:hypothetical protein
MRRSQYTVARKADLEYPGRLEARRAARDALSVADARLAYARLAAFFLALLLLILAWRPGISLWWLLVPALGFVWLARNHARVLRAREMAGRAIAFYERGLARLEDRWAGTGEPGERFRDDNHPYANDLDLFGRGSLFELLSIARTQTGEATLAGWLKAPADVPEIRARQEAIEELAPELDLRERLALTGIDVGVSVKTDRLIEWAELPMPPRRALRAVVWMATIAMALASLYLAATTIWWPLGVVILLLTAALRHFREPIDAILSARQSAAAAGFVADVLSHRVRDLETLAELLAQVEERRFLSARLERLRVHLTDGNRRASRLIARLHLLDELNDWQKNATLLPVVLAMAGLYTGRTWLVALAAVVIGALMVVRPHVALAVERWRTVNGPRVRIWVDTIAQVEAFNSLAGYRYEQAADPFPEIVATDDVPGAGAIFDAAQLRHPLLPRATVVPNDVRLDDSTRLLVVSGSNMSGKSTLLRAVGINAVMALAGAPVRAASLRVSPLAVGATLRIQDSLLEGRSRFYAEITRIRLLVDIAGGPVPLLFLLDELFHGTNSHDRLVGAQGVLRSLLTRRAIGLITTHDLALTAIVDELAPRAVNVHFQDWFDAGEMRFDYRMRPGPVARSNALALMRAVGLDVDDAPAAG